MFWAAAKVGGSAGRSARRGSSQVRGHGAARRIPRSQAGATETYGLAVKFHWFHTDLVSSSPVERPVHRAPIALQAAARYLSAAGK